MSRRRFLADSLRSSFQQRLNAHGIGFNASQVRRIGSFVEDGGSTPPPGNGLLNGLRECWEPSGGVMVGRQNGLNLTNVNGATVDTNGLHLDKSLFQYASRITDALLQFPPGTDYTLMSTFRMSSLPDVDLDGGYSMLSKGGNAVSPEWRQDVWAYLDDAFNPPGPSVAITHGITDVALWDGPILYTPQTNHLYTAFSYFTHGTPTTGTPPGPDATPDTLTMRLYSTGESVIEVEILNPYWNGSYNNTEDFTLGAAGEGTYFWFDGTIIKGALWGRELEDDEMDAYWNSAAPLPFASWN